MIITEEQIEAVAKALNDADSFYEMFEGWEGVPERIEHLNLAWRALEELQLSLD
jgi:hypothetical protein|tara:strand:+ start:378 stop:539 length:162 start_codon:yes stop_codon:yes gene_type:complete